MGKNKHKRFAENLTFRCMIQPDFETIFNGDHEFKGRWGEAFFGNQNPIVLELGCGRGEYTIALAQRHPELNFIGIDIKGARMWRGAKTATDEGLPNVAFLRTRIEFIGSFFAASEVSQIWITFPDPQLKKNRAQKRLTSPMFLARYAKFLAPNGIVQLKTDSQHLHEYTKSLLEQNGITPEVSNNDIYGTGYADEKLSIKTTYEAKFLVYGLPITYLSWCLGKRTEFLAPLFWADEQEGTLDDNRIKIETTNDDED